MALVLALLLSAFGAARAQEAARLRLAVQGPSATPLESLRALGAPTPADSDTVERSNPVAHGAKLGALVGLMAGVAYTLVLNVKKSCTESQGYVCPEDAKDLSTLLVPVYGAALGAVGGAIIGATRR